MLRMLDVAAILCVVSVLVFLGLLGTNRFRQSALRTNCRAHLLQIGLAMQLYAHDNRGMLPDCTDDNFAGAQWPWDLHTNLAAALQVKGISRDSFYCPANPAMNDDRHWNFWHAAASPMRVVGYPMLLKGIRQVPQSLWRSNVGGNGKTSTSQAELAFDATAGVDDDFLSIKGLWTDRSNHVHGKQPLGGNILFLDQHASWRDFDEMQPRFRTIGPGGWVEWSF